MLVSVTSGNESGERFAPQLEHEPQEPPRLSESRSQACRARNPAAMATIEIAKMSCMEFSARQPIKRMPIWYVSKAPMYASTVM